MLHVHIFSHVFSVRVMSTAWPEQRCAWDHSSTCRTFPALAPARPLMWCSIPVLGTVHMYHDLNVCARVSRLRPGSPEPVCVPCVSRLHRCLFTGTGYMCTNGTRSRSVSCVSQLPPVSFYRYRPQVLERE